ncbi:MAG: hypothetical protein AABX39_05335, partial [Nanoarchaeota archaeon]
MAKEMNLSEKLQRFRLVNAVNNYLEDRPKYNLYHTTNLVLLYLNKDRIASEDKTKMTYKEISKLEEEIEKFVRIDVKNITKKTREEVFHCARSHIEKITQLREDILENSLEIDLE